MRIREIKKGSPFDPTFQKGSMDEITPNLRYKLHSKDKQRHNTEKMIWVVGRYSEGTSEHRHYTEQVIWVVYNKEKVL